MPIVPASILSIAAGIPTTRSVVTALASGSGSLTTPFNANATALDVLGRAGAGAYAIDWDSNPASSVLPGLDLTVSSGLTLAIAAGQAVIDGVVQKTAPTTFVCTDNIARSYIWMSQNGTVSAVQNSIVPPSAAPYVFLGSVVTASGAITEINGSGVMYLRGSTLHRRTADVTTPLDSPPAGLIFVNEGPNDAWLWSGTAYLLIAGNQAGLFPTVINSGETWTIPSGRQAVLAIDLTVNGALVVGGRLKVIGDS